MKYSICDLRLAICAAGALLGSALIVSAQETNRAPQPIDLTTALRLAGAQNLDVQIADVAVAEAKANQQSALAQFFPWLAPGVSYRRHDGNIQDVAGNIVDVNKYSYAPGVGINAQVDLGDALFKSLAARRVTDAARHGLESRRQDSVLAAARGYFELAQAQAAIGAAEEAVKLSEDYSKQIENAVETGLAFKGDQFRVAVQSGRNQMALEQAREQQRIAAARLAQALHLDPAVELVAADAAPVPLALVAANTALSPVVQQALAARAELRQSRSLAEAARAAKQGAAYGPLIPTLGAQAFFGELGGARSGIGDMSGRQEDYFVGVSWHIGPGGLGDFTRIRSAEARLRAAELATQKLTDDVTRQAVEGVTHWQSAGRQVTIAQRALAAAEEGFRLARERREFAVGAVLETLLAEQDLTRARLDYLKTVADFNTAQYALQQVTGKL